MSDIGTELRWILIIGSAVLIAAIYIAGRWGRRQSVANDVEAESSRDALRRDNSSASIIPQLETVVSSRERHVEPHVTFVADEDFPHDDDLPSVHIDAHFSDYRFDAGRADTSEAITANDADEEEESITALSSATLATASPATNETFSSARVEPAVDDYAADGDEEETPAPAATAQSSYRSPPLASTASPTAAAPPKKVSSRKVIALRLISSTQRFDGTQLKIALETAKLRHGKYDIFHCLDEQGLILFSVASMVEPGTFDPHTMSGMQFQGITFFAQLPGPIDGAMMFEQMLESARHLAGSLNGTLQDERGMVLTAQRTERIRDDIADFQHLMGIDSLRPPRATATGSNEDIHTP